MKQYPPHLWTLEWQLPAGLPTLFHHYASEAEGRAGFRQATSHQAKNPGAFLGLKLFHRHQLQASAVPPVPTVHVFPAPGPDGIRRLPAVARELRPSSRFFNSAELTRLAVVSDDEIRL